MEQQQEEILMRRSFQKKTVALVLSVLARGLKVCRSVDEPVREVFDGFPEDFIFVLGVYGSRHPVVLQNRRTGLYRAHETVAAASQKIPLPPATALAKHFSAGEYDRRQMLEIRFKSVEAAFRMVTGQLSAEQAYARHDLIIRGEIDALSARHPAGGRLSFSADNGKTAAAGGPGTSLPALAGVGADAPSEEKTGAKRRGGRIDAAGIF